MKGDFSRTTFAAGNHYNGVLYQQGRVITDADHNEAQQITSYRIETEAIDVIGHSGAPKENPGFGLTINPAGDLLIGAGHYYVDGILCENEVVVSYTAQRDFPNPPAISTLMGNATIGLVYLHVFKRHLTFHDRDQIRDEALHGVDTTTRVQTVWQVGVLPLPSVTLVSSALTTLVNLAAQIETLNQTIASTTDPTTRANLVRQRDSLQRQLTRTSAQLGIRCDGNYSEWNTLTAASTGALEVTTIPGGSPTDPCDVPPGGGYTRGENQFYIVEVHSTPPGGGRDGATFKWSRDNGSIVARIEAVGNASSGTASGTVLNVNSVQRDDYLGIHTDDWVEYTDDTRELHGLAGLLAHVVDADSHLNQITLDRTITVQLDHHPKLRKWDQSGTTATDNGVAMNTTDTPLLLETGIQLQFANGIYHAGDYWQFAARAINGQLDFPTGAQPAFGVRHHYARLGMVAWSGERLHMLVDCRNVFPPLTELTGFFYVGGGGQEAMPGQRLPCPLQVAVMNGQAPVVGAQVHFAITAGGGGILHAGTRSDIALTVNTDVNGVAQCDWQLGSVGVEEGHRCLQVEARRIDAAGELADPPIRFNANLSIASQVAYDPSKCRDLTAAGVRTVQDAIDQLCQQTPAREPGIGIKTILSIADGAELLNDVFVPVSRLAQGLRISCDAPLGEESFGGAPADPPPIFPQTVSAKPTCFVTLDLPYPLGADSTFWDFTQIVGFQPLIVGSVVSVRENEIDWVPTAAANAWLQQVLFARLVERQIADRVLAHLTLKGNFIWRREQDRDPEVYLDGEAYGRPGTRGRVDLRFPTGDGRRGGDFEMWFWLGPRSVIAPDIDVTPTSLTFGNVVVGQSPTQSLTVRNTGNAPLTVAAFTSNNPRFSVVLPAVPFTVAPNGQQPVTVRFSPTTAGPQSGVLSIASNDPDEPSVPIQLQGVGVAPEINVAPLFLNFGSVIGGGGQSADLTLTVGNTGNAPLRITSVTITSGQPTFRVISPPPTAPFTVAPNEQQRVIVRFTPTGHNQTWDGELRITSNDPDEPSVPIQLQGTSPIG